MRHSCVKKSVICAGVGVLQPNDLEETLCHERTRASSVGVRKGPFHKKNHRRSVALGPRLTARQVFTSSVGLQLHARTHTHIHTHA